MKKVIFYAVSVIIVFFLGYVSTRPSTFHYERSGLINANPEKIFPYLRDFKLGNQWSSYQKMDPEMKSSFSGPGTGVGSVMEFSGQKAGSGRLEILREIPGSLVEISLKMLKPIKGENLIRYQLTPEGKSTRFTWAMSGRSDFMGKLIGVLIDCEKMIGNQFSEGIENLKQIVESQK